ncbi:MAG: glycosyltransferase [Magnetococcales bacterium]|nr:glycosyltransferase [Magnetococcales bacterium]
MPETVTFSSPVAGSSVHQPTVSVLLSVYNGASSLPRAIDSILRQSWKDFECILIDDGSSDASRAIIESYAQRDKRIVPILDSANLGLTRRLNQGVGLARGRYIARQDADDSSHPDRLAKQVAFMETHPLVGLLGTAAQVMDARGHPVGKHLINPCTHTEQRWRLILTNPFFHTSVMFRRQLVVDNPYDESLRYGQDYELWGRLLQFTRGANLPDTLVLLGRDDQRISVRHGEQQFAQGLGVMKQRLCALLPNTQWDADLVRMMRQITQSHWPTPNETALAWQWVLRLFIAFSRQEHLNPNMVLTIRRQLIQHLLLSLSSPTGPRLTAPLLALFLTRFAHDSFPILFRDLKKRLLSKPKREFTS